MITSSIVSDCESDMPTTSIYDQPWALLLVCKAAREEILYNNITNSLVPGEGWMVWVGASPKTTDVTGPLKTGDVNISIPYNSNPTNTIERGWALIGNP